MSLDRLLPRAPPSSALIPPARRAKTNKLPRLAPLQPHHKLDPIPQFPFPTIESGDRRTRSFGHRNLALCTGTVPFYTQLGRNNMAPRGPRAGSSAGRETRSSTLNSKSTRGGISKRKGGVRIDNDGDLDMGSGSARRSSAPAGDSKRGRGSKSSSRGASKVAQTVMKHLSSGDGSRLEGRVKDPNAAKAARSKVNRASGLSFLRIHGLKSSKAVENEGGGVPDLLAFLERKATTFLNGTNRRPVQIKKVC